MRTQWTTKGNREAGSSCSRDRGLHRYLRNFGGGLNTPNHPPRYATGYNMPRLLPTDPQWLTYVGLCFHIVWCNTKGVGDREILETYLNSASKNTWETDNFPHGTKSLLTSFIRPVHQCENLKLQSNFSIMWTKYVQVKKHFTGSSSYSPFCNILVKVKQSCYRPRVAQGVPAN